MAANTVTLLNEIALKSNIESPVFTGIITGDGGAISNISLQHVTEYGNSTDQRMRLAYLLIRRVFSRLYPLRTFYPYSAGRWVFVSDPALLFRMVGIADLEGG